MICVAVIWFSQRIYSYKTTQIKSEKKTSQDAQLLVERAPIHLMDKCEFAECLIPLSQVVEMIKFVPKSAEYQDSWIFESINLMYKWPWVKFPSKKLKELDQIHLCFHSKYVRHHGSGISC